VKSTKKKSPPPTIKAPKASRPLLPLGYGVPKDLKGSVSWAWAKKRLTDSHNYLLTTVRPDGRPHTMVVWGMWLDNAYYFSTGSTTRKAQNLAANPNCVVCNEDVEEAVIVEGRAQQLEVSQIPKQAFPLYFKKYGWKLDPEMGHVFKVMPLKIIAMPEKLFPKGATRWVFE
jgi:nitroimidazol reductase NimA-like FMN-containing flavoprotein (pyridoxamine 5'-phosphate oxidase superfamily)